ncbi:MAG TPA: photosystem II protein Psb27 [Coleofasciculaceae cyanobacterium]
MKRIFSSLFALLLVVCIGLTGCSSPDGLTGNFRQDTIAALDTLRSAIELPDDATNRVEIQSEAKQLINNFVARYRRDGSLTRLTSYTTMRTALNSLAAHYASYPNRPLPQKLKDRLELEFNQVQQALERGA